MRIGMVTACYKPIINGVTRMVSLYKHHLEAAGHDVTVFTLGDPDPADEPGVVRSPGLMLADSGYYVSVRYSNQAQALMQQMEIIHCHHLFMSVEMAHRYGRCPIVYTNHTRYDLYTGAVISLPQPAADAIMRQIWPEFTDFADVVITPSESLRQVMRDFGVRRPIECIENGVDLRPFHNPVNPHTKTSLGIPKSAVLYVYVGRLAPEKNVDLLLNQFAIARDVAPDLHLMIVGDGPSRSDLQKLVDGLNITPNVTFIGAVDYEQVANYLVAADLFVTASVTEVHPLTVIEAMAAGLPVVAVSSPGIIETVESRKSGLLTTHPVGGLAAAMAGLAFNRERRMQMGIAARRASERFDIQNTVCRTLALYERLRGERPDLRRKRMHGRKIFTRKRLEPVVGQFGRLIRPVDKIGSRRKWSGAGRHPYERQEQNHKTWS
jgi:1,2-diacylglycerol 3-alpha-glucosyltransferase